MSPTSRSSLLKRGVLERRAVTMSRDGAEAPDAATWGIAVEAPVEIALNGTPWTVMLATPADVEDLAVGLALTEGVLRDAHAVQQVTVSEFLHDISVNLVVPEHQLNADAVRARSLLSNTGCGLCGLESLAQLHQRAPRAAVASSVEIADTAIAAAFAALPASQPIFRETHSVHAAAWCEPDGTLVLVREDVGRHNALDKLMGALARRDMLAQPGFVVMSSRCSYELVYKAAVANTLLLATISAPTSMALEWSAALALPLACCFRSAGAARVVRFASEQTADVGLILGAADGS